jgi:hypothetical protein
MGGVLYQLNGHFYDNDLIIFNKRINDNLIILDITSYSAIYYDINVLDIKSLVIYADAVVVNEKNDEIGFCLKTLKKFITLA